MNPESLQGIARALVADGKGILAADETPSTLSKRLQAQSVESTPDSRRAYRELFFTTPGISTFISGVILQDETIRQTASTGQPMPALVKERGMIPGIKVDEGARPLANSPGELVTEGLDGLRHRLKEYHALGARFAKWRAVISIGGDRPTLRSMLANAEALARYAALCQEQDLVPIVEPEVLMDGAHGLERCAEVTSLMLHAVFDALHVARVPLDGLLLKPNMVTAGHEARPQATVPEVARATLVVLGANVPPAVPGIVFLSGGQSPVLATEHLNAINREPAPKPWTLSFSYGRALQDEALAAWKGRAENVVTAQAAFEHRAGCAHAAARGEYRSEQEQRLHHAA